MKIGIDASRAFINEPTGTERYSYELISRLIRLPEAKKHEWILYVRKSQKSKIKSQKYKSKVKIIEIPLYFLWTQVGLAARTWIDNLDCLWVPAHTLPVFRRPGIKTVVTIHGIEYEWLPAYENWLQRWYLPLSTKYAVASADKIIAVSGFTKRQLVERLGADPKKIDVIYEGVSKQRSVTSVQRSEILHKLILRPGSYLLFIGTIQPRKNLERLVEAFKYLTPRPSPNLGEGGKLKLVISGKWGWGYEKLRDITDKNIIFTGYVDDTTRQILLENALVYVQPSITEGFGLPVLEAMAAGVPVASSNGGALSEIINVQYSMSNKILFDPYNVEDMVAKIKLVLTDDGLRRAMIKEGLENNFSWDKAARETYNILTKWR
ncbi:MAG: putative glycosyltransferase [Microgenomates group bacterium Gr01-1014_16]|nr:MAG: putative glycosyltransferase [Microgenomates group bacterium Gr01-1014_16]